MNCPFCAEEIKDEAVVCKHCQRDLTVLRPVIERFAAVNRRLDAAEAAAKKLAEGALDVNALAERLAALEELVANRDTLPADAAPVAAGPGTTVPLVERIAAGVAAIIVPILALLAAHWLVVIVYDLKTWVIRLISLLLPLPFAIFMEGGRRTMVERVLAGAVIGVAAVMGMSALTGWIDHQPMLPGDSREWQEVVEYAVSIWLSYLTGALLQRQFFSGGEAPAKSGVTRRVATGIVDLVAPPKESREQMEERIKSMATVIGALVPVVTAVVSVIAGLKELWK